MASTTTFETLALELSPSERSELLGRLQRGFTVSTEPLYDHSLEHHATIDYGVAYRELGFFVRLMISVQSLLGHGSKEELVRTRFVRDISRGVETKFPGLIDSKRRVLNEAFYRELTSMRGAARYFYDILDRTLEKNRPAFYAFFASLELEAVHTELSIETDPYIYAERNSQASESDVRVAITQALDAAISKIGDEERRSLYREVKNLHVLKRLSGFLFDRFLGSFQTNKAGLKELSMYAAIEQLGDLVSTLSSLDQPPSAKLMEAIIGFALNDEVGREGFDLEEAAARELASAERALAVIREFNASVPLEDILRIANDDPNWQCSMCGGGEDWFTIFKSYWKDRVDRRFQRFSAERRVALLESEIQALVGKDPPGWFVNLSESGTDSTPPLRFAKALRFLEAFYHHAFLGDINKPLKTILLDGEFYKRDNRMDFTDAYNEILQTGDALKRLDARLSPNGELGAAYALAQSEMASTQIKRRKIESAIKAAETESEALLARSGDAMARLNEILKAILSREARGRYDSLSNFSSIDGRANKDFQRSLESAKDKLERAKYLLGELVRSAVGARDQ